MGQTGRFWSDLEAAFGEGNVTSGYRTQEEQDALVRRGATRATRSSHTYEDGYDLAIGAARNEQEIRDRLAARGLSANRIRRETGRGRNQGTGPHWHVELAMGQGVDGGGGPGQGVANPADFLAALESELGPEAMASGAVTVPTQTAFGGDAELQTRADAVESALDAQGGMIDVLTQVTDAAQATQLASMTEMVEETRAISNEISTGTEELRRQVQPVFQARGRVADQLDRLATMNPLERGIRGIFDLNYDRKFLENQLEHYDRTLEVRANDYDYIGRLHQAALGEIERRYSLDNALPGLAVAQAEEDLGIVGMRIQQTAGLLGNLRDRVSGETQMISARAMAREDTMNRLDGPTRMGLANQAKAGNGVVTFNGIEFSYAELRDSLERDEDQELNRKAHRMAIASSQMDMAEQFATNIARSLTRTQAEAAIANNGMWNGVQLPQDVLQNVYQNHIATAQTQAESLATTMPSSIALRTASDELMRVRRIQQRTQNMFGGQGLPDMATYLQNGTETIRQLIQATEEGAPPEVIAALTQRIAQNSQVVEQRLDAALLRQAGGNKEAAGYLKSFVMGTPMDSAAGVQAVTYFATRGARPDGIAMSPESKQIFQQAERIVARIRADQPNISAENLRQKVSIELGEYAGRTVGAARYERLSRDLPTLARHADHQFGKLPQQAWSQVRATAAAAAYESIAQQLDISPAQVRQMRTTGKPLTNDQAGKDLFAAFQAQVGNFNAVEQDALVRGLDELPLIQPGRRNSSVYLDFLGSPALQQQAETYSSALGSESFGDFIVNPMTQGALESVITQDTEGVRQAQAQATQSQRQAARAVASGYGNSPVMRTSVILRSIPGVGKDGAEKLTPLIRQFVDSNLETFSLREYNAVGTGVRQVVDSPGFEFDNTRMVREENAVLNFLQQSKFEDPTLEAYRKQAIRGWADSAQQSNTFMENIMDTLNPF